MNTQNYSNHRRIDPTYHYVLTLLCAIALIGSLVYAVVALASGYPVTLALLVFLLSINGTCLFLLIRSYALKAQDRAIRAEESLRHYVLTGQLLPSGLTMRQIVALRFASDQELPSLSQRAATEKLAADEIKKAITAWRADHNRI